MSRRVQSRESNTKRSVPLKPECPSSKQQSKTETTCIRRGAGTVNTGVFES